MDGGTCCLANKISACVGNRIYVLLYLLYVNVDGVFRGTKTIRSEVTSSFVRCQPVNEVFLKKFQSNFDIFTLYLLHAFLLFLF
jgi:hypothetical protein